MNAAVVESASERSGSRDEDSADGAVEVFLEVKNFKTKVSRGGGIWREIKASGPVFHPSGESLQGMSTCTGTGTRYLYNKA